jgi:hypothetical protein
MGCGWMRSYTVMSFLFQRVGNWLYLQRLRFWVWVLPFHHPKRPQIEETLAHFEKTLKALKDMKRGERK